MNKRFWGFLFLGTAVITIPAAIFESKYWTSILVLGVVGGGLLLWWWLDRRRKGK